MSAKGYELFDLENKIVWLTSEFTDEEFQALELPPGWIKNDSARVPHFDKGRFVKSPGSDDKLTTRSMYGHNFLHVCNMLELPHNADKYGLIKSATVEKYHEVTYTRGKNIRVLTGPQGNQYMYINSEGERGKEIPKLPDGWILEEGTLEEDLTVDLSGKVEVLRLSNNDSYQRVFGKDVNFRKYLGLTRE